MAEKRKKTTATYGIMSTIKKTNGQVFFKIGITQDDLERLNQLMETEPVIDKKGTLWINLLSQKMWRRKGSFVSHQLVQDHYKDYGKDKILTKPKKELPKESDDKPLEEPDWYIDT